MVDLRRLLGTLLNKFQIGINGPMLTSDASVIACRDLDDTAFRRIKAGDPVEANDLVTKQVYDAGIALTVPQSRLVDTEEGVKGGGDLSADRTLSLDINGLASFVSPDNSADYVAVYDSSAGIHKKVLLQDIAARALTQTISQAAHGFVVGDWLRFNGATWVKAVATPGLEAVGVVSNVIDPNTFILHLRGLMTGFSGLTPGAPYFLSPTTAGAITATEPSRAGLGGGPLQRSQEVLLAITATSGVVNITRPIDTDGHYYGSNRFVNVRTTLAATAGATPILYLSTGAIATNVGSLYKVTWSTSWGVSNLTEPIKIDVDLNNTGPPFLNTNATGTFRSPAPITPFPVSYSGFAYFFGTGSDTIDIDFSAPAAGGGVVGMSSAWIEVIRVNK